MPTTLSVKWTTHTHILFVSWTRTDTLHDVLLLLTTTTAAQVLTWHRHFVHLCTANGQSVHRFAFPFSAALSFMRKVNFTSANKPSGVAAAAAASYSAFLKRAAQQMSVTWSRQTWAPVFSFWHFSQLWLHCPSSDYPTKTIVRAFVLSSSPTTGPIPYWAQETQATPKKRNCSVRGHSPVSPRWHQCFIPLECHQKQRAQRNQPNPTTRIPPCSDQSHLD